MTNPIRTVVLLAGIGAAVLVGQSIFAMLVRELKP